MPGIQGRQQSFGEAGHTLWMGDRRAVREPVPRSAMAQRRSSPPRWSSTSRSPWWSRNGPWHALPRSSADAWRPGVAQPRRRGWSPGTHGAESSGRRATPRSGGRCGRTNPRPGAHASGNRAECRPQKMTATGAKTARVSAVPASTRTALRDQWWCLVGETDLRIDDLAGGETPGAQTTCPRARSSRSMPADSAPCVDRPGCGPG